MDNEETQNITCLVCGGKDFITEGGFYYCSECQTQTQELQEHHFEREDIANKVFVETKTRTKKTTKGAKTVQLTSWEGYNYILAGLVEELINLGANSELKAVTYELWIMYLMELEILSKKGYAKPKLGARYRAKDAILVYQHQKRKRRRSVSSASSLITDSTDKRAMSRENRKQKKAMARLEYESFSANTQSSDTSLLNKTLSTIGSSEDESLESEKHIKFNKRSRKELLKRMSHHHLRKHVTDIENKLRCHKTKKKDFTTTYLRSEFVLSRNKIYSILYLGLQLSKSDIQLSDMLRYCREGHLSFLSYNNFFPESYTEKQIDLKVYQSGNKAIPSHKNIREMSYKIFNMFKLGDWVFIPDLNKLCEKYCLELNLPDEIKNMALNLINKTKPAFKIKKLVEGEIPNYEGRIMAFIILILKLLYSLDGVTEYKFSDFATQINEKDCDSAMFVFSDWIKFIEYRKIILKSQHFPTAFLLDSNGQTNSNLFLHFLKKQQSDCESDKTKLSVEVLQKLLTDLEGLQDERVENFLDFPVTLTPFHTYTKKIMEDDRVLIYNNPVNKDMLCDFQTTSVDFLLHPRKHMKMLNGNDFVILENGAVRKSNLIKMISKENGNVDENEWEKAFKELKIDELSINKLDDVIMHKLRQSQSDNKKDDSISSSSVKHPEINPNLIKSETSVKVKNTVVRNNKGRFCKKSADSSNKTDSTVLKSPRKRGKWFHSSWTPNSILENNDIPSLYKITNGKSLESIVESKLKQKKLPTRSRNNTYNIHYEHYFEYWINITDVNSKKFNKSLWDDLKTSLPFTFTWLLNECAMVIEQNVIDLYKEFVTVELFVMYNYLNKSPTFTTNGNDNFQEISKLITKAMSEW